MRIGVDIKLKHPDLWEALLRRGWTQAEGARYLGVGPYTFGLWLNLRWYPRRLSDEQVAALMELTGKTPEDLWPDAIRDPFFLAIPKRKKTFTEIDLRRLAGACEAKKLPFEILEQGERKRVIDEVLQQLSSRQRAVIRARFYEGLSLKEVGERFGVTGENIRRIETQALNRLRHPCRAKTLRELL